MKRSDMTQLSGKVVTARTTEFITDVAGSLIGVTTTEEKGLFVFVQPYNSPSPLLNRKCQRIVHDHGLRHEVSGRDGSTTWLLNWVDEHNEDDEGHELDEDDDRKPDTDNEETKP